MINIGAKFLSWLCLVMVLLDFQDLVLSRFFAFHCGASKAQCTCTRHFIVV